eukprot:1761158-Pyramimonas_sp.AAC.1
MAASRMTDDGPIAALEVTEASISVAARIAQDALARVPDLGSRESYPDARLLALRAAARAHWRGDNRAQRVGE